MHPLAIRVAEAADAPALAALASQHTHQQLTEAEQQGGFLTGTFPVPALRAMLASVPGQVAYFGPELAGFVVNSRLPAAQYPPLVQAIIDQLPTLRYQQRALAAYRWFFYGPVLVSPPRRCP